MQSNKTTNVTSATILRWFLVCGFHDFTLALCIFLRGPLAHYKSDLFNRSIECLADCSLRVQCVACSCRHVLVAVH